MAYKIIDAHAHIHGEEYDQDREEILSRMRGSNVACITVGTDLEDSKNAVALVEKEENVWATIGIHPTDTKSEFREEDFESLVKSKKVVGIGECGLDYFRGADSAEKERQKENFKRQVDFALKHDLPLMIHCRPSVDSSDAHDDLLSILGSYFSDNKKPRGNIHFFTGSREVAEKYFTLGFTVSIPGVVTFARDVAKVVKDLPLEKILVETDCPYATPVPYRGKRNEPMFVLETARKIAELKGESEDNIWRKTTKNCQRIFRFSK